MLSPRRLRSLWIALGLFASSACTPSSEPLSPRAPLAAPVGSPNGSSGPVTFREGGFESALEDARRTRRRLVVDAWAPWCHTCLSMRETVLNSPALGPFAADFVFVAIDTDRPDAEGFVTRYPMSVWPTFFIVDPDDGAVVSSYGGSLSLEEFAAFLRRGAASATDETGTLALRKGHEAFSRKDYPRAAEYFRTAYGELPVDAKKDAAIALMRSLSLAERWGDCVTFGLSVELYGSSAPADFAGYLLACAERLDEKDARVQEAKKSAEVRYERFLSNPPAGASVDDRADAHANLAELYLARGDIERSRAESEIGLRLLEEAASSAATPEAAQVHDYARMNAYLALGRGNDAIAMLTARMALLPESYEPPARLGSTLLKLDRPADAIAPLEKAIALAYGPRRTRYLGQLSLALERTGELPRAIAIAREERDALGLEPADASQRSRRAAVEARITKLEEMSAKAP